jgi:L-seryl-tRNA(Ser) seleniumtransferase
MSGFVSEVGLGELAEIGRARGLPVLEDLGSGGLIELPGLPAEAFAPGRLRLGADLVCFSGDKLLGGPQAGLLLGSAETVAALRGNPMARALRLDKLSLAALDWTLGVHLEGRAAQEIPVLRQLLAPLEELEARARRLAERIAKVAGDGATVSVRAERAMVGGGSLPGFELPGWVAVVSLPVAGRAERVAAGLRAAALPVVARVRDDEVLFDVRTLLDDDESAVEQALREVLLRAGR